MILVIRQLFGRKPGHVFNHTPNRYIDLRLLEHATQHALPDRRKPLLDDGVKFYATIGNHDDPNQPFYPPFNMNGERYYTFKPPSLVSRAFGTGD